MSNLPKGWRVVQLKDIFERVTRKNEENNSNALTISAQQGLINQKEFFNKIVASKNLSNYYLLHNGEFAYNKSYSAGYPMGVIKRLDRYDKGVLSTLYICFRINSNHVNTDYVLEYFSAGNFDKEISTIAQEGARNHGLLNVGVKDFFNLQMILPPLEEQKKIADILSTVDKKIAFVEENINATEELKKGLMQKLLTEGIGHTEFKDSSIGKVPSSWKVVKLVEAISIMTDYVANGSFASLAANVNVYDEPNYAIYVRLFDLRKGLGHSEQKYVDEESYKFLSKSNLEGREILIANIGANVGETFLMPDINKPATLAPNMIEVKVDPEKLISEFLYFYLNGHIGLKELEKVTEGSGQPKINKTKLKTINVPLPDLEEQSKIIEILSTVDKKIENLKEKKQSFEELKKGLMQKLLTGEVRV